MQGSVWYSLFVTAVLFDNVVTFLACHLVPAPQEVEQGDQGLHWDLTVTKRRHACRRNTKHVRVAIVTMSVHSGPMRSNPECVFVLCVVYVSLFGR